MTIPSTEQFTFESSGLNIENFNIYNYGEFTDTSTAVAGVSTFQFFNYGKLVDAQMYQVNFTNFGNVTGDTLFSSSSVSLYGGSVNYLTLSRSVLIINTSSDISHLYLHESTAHINSDVKFDQFIGNISIIQSSGAVLEVLDLVYDSLQLRNITLILGENGTCTVNLLIGLEYSVFVNKGYISMNDASLTLSNSKFVNIGTLDHINTPEFIVDSVTNGTMINLGTINLQNRMTVSAEFMHCSPGIINFNVSSNFFPYIRFKSPNQNVTLLSDLVTTYPNASTQYSLLPIFEKVLNLYGNTTYFASNYAQDQYLCWDDTYNITIQTDLNATTQNCRNYTSSSPPLPCPSISDFLYVPIPSDPPTLPPSEAPTSSLSEPPSTAPSTAPPSAPSSTVPLTVPSEGPTINLDLRITVSFSNYDISAIDNIITELSGILQVVKQDINYTISNATNNTKYKYIATFIISNPVSSTTSVMTGDDLVTRVVNNFNSIDQLFQRSLGEHSVLVTSNGNVLVSDSTVVQSTITQWVAVLLILITVSSYF
eukprot:TRINITY_DN1941_c0_g1_i2.p1 TRINITY_DN1941_c0_g1~~TRINITY_DN1941_c0_g1_i2.p1  ORF type:complete len:539 (-),score=45.66 TRINITY_DN1941_c0_g1_i2:60-1676(-)